MAQALTLEGYLIGHPSGLKIRPQHKHEKIFLLKNLVLYLKPSLLYLGIQSYTIICSEGLKSVMTSIKDIIIIIKI